MGQNGHAKFIRLILGDTWVEVQPIGLVGHHDNFVTGRCPNRVVEWGGGAVRGRCHMPVCALHNEYTLHFILLSKIVLYHVYLLKFYIIYI